jgi:hypothetical protein
MLHGSGFFTGHVSCFLEQSPPGRRRQRRKAVKMRIVKIAVRKVEKNLKLEYNNTLSEIEIEGGEILEMNRKGCHFKSHTCNYHLHLPPKKGT